MPADVTPLSTLPGFNSSLPPRIKLYGERNTGTNYLASLLAINLDAVLLTGVVSQRTARMAARVERFSSRMGSSDPGTGELVKDYWFWRTFKDNLGWKHMLVRRPDELSTFPISVSTLFVTIVKNPYSWLLSFHRRPYHLKIEGRQSLVQFASESVSSVGRENTPGGFASPIAMWNEKARSYLRLAAEFPTVIVRFEDLLEDPQRIVMMIATEARLTMNSENFLNVTTSTKGEKDREFNWYRDYYLAERWRSKIDPESAKVVRDSLDPHVCRSLGYQRELTG